LNTPTYAAGMPAVPHAHADDGHLDLLVAGQFTPWQALRMLPQLLAGRHLSHPAVHSHAFQTLEIRSSQPLPLAADGEFLGRVEHLRFEIQPARLRVAASPSRQAAQAQ
jgi:diacylglycerol kinase family enzyme